MAMPAGEYYIGDLCYVLNSEWDDFCDMTITGNHIREGEFSFPDGRNFAAYCTMYGDGEYYPNIGGSCGVDAGLIGCILLSDIKDEVDPKELGIVVKFAAPFTTSSSDGVIRFGHVTIDTSCSDDEDDDDEPDVGEAQEWHDFDPDC